MRAKKTGIRMRAYPRGGGGRDAAGRAAGAGGAAPRHVEDEDGVAGGVEGGEGAEVAVAGLGERLPAAGEGRGARGGSEMRAAKSRTMLRAGLILACVLRRVSFA